MPDLYTLIGLILIIAGVLVVNKATTVDDLKSKWEAYSSKIAKLDNNHQKLVQTCYKTALSTLRQDYTNQDKKTDLKPKSA